MVLDYPREPNVITRMLRKGRWRLGVREQNVTVKQRWE